MTDPMLATPDAASAELQQLLLDTDGVQEFLQELATLTVKVLPEELSCGITVRRDRHPMTVASSDARAAQVDEIQYEHDQGPCLTSLSTSTVVLVEDLAEDHRWEAYRVPALAHGIRSSLSLPLRGGADLVGALNVYAAEPRAFGPAEQIAAARFAAEASRALALAVRLAERAETSEHLQFALASRAIIDQALGVVMGQQRCTADEAFAMLRTISQNRNTKLRDVAGEIITAVTGHPAATEARFH